MKSIFHHFERECQKLSQTRNWAFTHFETWCTWYFSRFAVYLQSFFYSYEQNASTNKTSVRVCQWYKVDCERALFPCQFFSQSLCPVLKISAYLIYIIFLDGIWNVLFLNNVPRTCFVNVTANESFAPFMHNVQKWPSILYRVHTVTFLKYV